MKMKKACVLVLLMVLCMTGCVAQRAEVPIDIADMPDIVFLNTVDPNTGDGTGISGMTFYDKNGNHYISTDEEVCQMGYARLVSEFASGNLSDKVELHTSCNIDELLENYQKLCEVAQNSEYSIVYPEAMPTVDAEICSWYGLYYDENGELRSLTIHKKERLSHLYANDERANEIYDWYLGTFQS